MWLDSGLLLPSKHPFQREVTSLYQIDNLRWLFHNRVRWRETLKDSEGQKLPSPTPTRPAKNWGRGVTGAGDRGANGNWELVKGYTNSFWLYREGARGIHTEIQTPPITLSFLASVSHWPSPIRSQRTWESKDDTEISIPQHGARGQKEREDLECQMGDIWHHL